jgi:hypothetical protein
MPIVDVEIRGLSALLQHRFGEQAEAEEQTRAVTLRHGTPREQAEAVCYRAESGEVYFPGQAIARLLREAGGNHKQRGTRKSVKYIVPAAVIVPLDAVFILDKNGDPWTTFEVDSRPVTIPATKGRIMRHRPRWDSWQAIFTLEIDETVLDVDLIHQLLEEGGRRIGIGDYRPEKGGPFGRFEIVRWEILT